MSHCRTPSLHEHLDHCFVVLKTHTTKLLDAKIGRLREDNQCDSRDRLFLVIENGSPRSFQESESCFQGQKRSDPRNQARVFRPTSIQRPKRWFRILLNCVKLKFVSYTSNLLEQMYDFQKTHNVPPDVDFESSRISCKIGVLKQSQSALFSSITPHDNIVCIHKYDECKISNNSIVCHKLWSIL